MTKIKSSTRVKSAAKVELVFYIYLRTTYTTYTVCSCNTSTARTNFPFCNLVFCIVVLVLSKIEIFNIRIHVHSNVLPHIITPSRQHFTFPKVYRPIHVTQPSPSPPPLPHLLTTIAWKEWAVATLFHGPAYVLCALDPICQGTDFCKSLKWTMKVMFHNYILIFSYA